MAIYEKPGVMQTDLLGNAGKKGQLDLTIEHSETTAIPEKDIETFIHSGERITENEARVLKEGRETNTYYFQLPESIRKNAKEIDEKLSSIKVCDPAIGSGAFPVGMMSEIVRARGVLNTFIQDNSRSSYHFKRQCIEKSLYGVDIDSGAVEIAKLRLWLSLVVDEDDIKQIKPLPNLDYKIVCGNSLLGLPHNMLLDDEISTQLEEKKKQYFGTTIPSEKNKIRSEIDDLFSKMMDNIKKYDPEATNVTFDFHTHFSEVFHEKNGFDVVIANPPYVRQESIKALKPDLAKTFAKFYCGTADLYTYFYKRGIELLNSGAHLCYIAPNKFMRASYGKNTRQLLAQEVTPLQIIDFGDLPIFDATTYPSIILVEKRTPNAKDLVNAATFTDMSQIEKPEETLKEIGFTLSPAVLKAEGWTLERPDILALMDKLRKAGKPLGEYVNGRFYYGIKTGLNEAFVIDEDTRKKLIAEDPKSVELIKPWLRGRDIKKWKAVWAGLHVIFTRRGTDIEKYPAIKNHLLQFRKDLEPKKSEKDKHGRKPGSYKWFDIQDNIAYHEEFEGPKIIIPAITSGVEYAIDKVGFYSNDKTSICIHEDSEYLCALMNSSVMWWFIRQLAATRRGDYYEFKPMYVVQLPIIDAAVPQKDHITEFVRKILAVSNSPDVTKFETEIDQMVYKLYGLTESEINIVEGK